MESKSGEKGVGFGDLQSRLRDLVARRISNGEFTERGFARRLGISQPQIHNVLKGARKLSPAMADLILSTLNMTVVDLLTDVECAASLSARHADVPRKPPSHDLLPRRHSDELAS